MLLIICLLLGFSSPIFAAETSEIEVPESLQEELKSFEPSAALYLDDLNSFLIASDDTDEKDSPFLFLMDAKGKVEEDPILIKGIKKMTDIESISQVGEKIYILSSLGLNKNGKDKKERNIFLQAQRSGKKVKVSKQVELRPIILDALEKSEDPILRSMRSKFADDLDIESHIVREGNLYLGLKNPQPQSGQAVLLNMGSVEDLFSKSKKKKKNKKIEESLQVSVIDFHSVSGKKDLLSEILPLNDKLYLTTTSTEGTGRFWRYDESTQKLELLKAFSGLKPEGLAYRRDENDIMIVFDQGTETARYTYFKL